MGEYTLYVHPYCVSSIRVLVYLHQKYRYPPSRLEVKALTDTYTPYMKLLIPSVPALVRDDDVLAIDPLEPELVEAVLEDDLESIRKYTPTTGGEAVKRYIDSIIASSYLMLKALLEPDLPAKLLDTDFYKYALRTRLSGNRDFKDYILENIGKVVKEVERYAPRITAFNYLRDLFLTHGDKLDYGEAVNHEKIMLWIIAKNSIGRIHMPSDKMYRNDRYRSAVDRIAKVLQNRFDKYLDKLIREYEYIKSNNYIVSMFLQR